jgi:hypothetical protein
MCLPSAGGGRKKKGGLVGRPPFFHLTENRKMIFSKPLCLYRQRFDRNIRPVILFFPENHFTVDQSKQGMIPAYADIQSRMMLSSSLANDNIASLADFSAENFNA